MNQFTDNDKIISTTVYHYLNIFKIYVVLCFNTRMNNIVHYKGINGWRSAW